MSVNNLKILGFSGSMRRESLNRKLILSAADCIRKTGVEVNIVEFSDLRMPIYDTDLQEQNGFPENVSKFRDLVKEHNGFFISTPEYNHSISPLLKNALDWASRSEGGEPLGFLFKGKAALMLSAAPGIYGGVRALIHLREILSALGLQVLPRQLALSRAKSAFNENNEFKDPNIEKEVTYLGESLVELSLSLEK